LTAQQLLSQSRPPVETSNAVAEWFRQQGSFQ
jgi:hypothetical protein